jgi:hypothetical protein
MSLGKWHKMILLSTMLSCVELFSSASSRPWKATPSQIAAAYTSIDHNRGGGDFVTIGWWAAPTVTHGTQLAALLEKYVLISVARSHVDFNAPAAGLRFDDITTLEALDGSGKALTPVSEEQLAPASIGLLATFEAGYRRGSGPCGKGTKFFLFDPGTVNACEKGGLSVPFDGETYTWETPLPGCSQ